MKPPVKKPIMTQKEVITESKKYPLDLESKYVFVSIDPSSTSCGISVFTTKGKYLDGFCIKVSSGIPSSQRLYFMRKKFIEEWEFRYGKETMASLCTLENLPMSRYAVLSNAAGAILSSGKITADLLPRCYISPSQWKFFSRELGCFMKDPKGVTALKAIGWQYSLEGVNDDVADSILIFLTSVWYSKGVVWLGENSWIQSWYVQKQKKVKVKNGKTNCRQSR